MQGPCRRSAGYLAGSQSGDSWATSGPGCAVGRPEPGWTPGAGHDRDEAWSEAFRFPAPQLVAGEGEHPIPGQQVRGQGDNRAEVSSRAIAFNEVFGSPASFAMWIGRHTSPGGTQV